jgi:membrane protein YqaA with SNARE-associated domain
MKAALALLATFGFCIVSAVIPVANAELYLLSAAALAPRELALPLAVAGALGQMVGKTLMYLAGRGAVRLPGTRMRRALEQVRTQYKDRGAIGGVVLFTSAAAGLPPFYIVAVAAGVVRVPIAQFVTIGLIGRAIRFGIVVMFPNLLK